MNLLWAPSNYILYIEDIEIVKELIRSEDSYE